MNNRKQHWEEVYRDKSPLEVSWYQTEPRTSLELIAHSGIGRDEPLIDVGGGASLLVDCLQATNHTRITVLDISSRALAHARQRLGATAAEVEWIEADVTQFMPAHRFALWHDRAVFHFLTEAADRQGYVESLKRALRPDGQVIIAAFAIGGPTRCSNLDVVQYDAEKLLRELGPDFRLEEQRTEAHRTPSGKEQQFVFFRLRRAGQVE